MILQQMLQKENMTMDETATQIMTDYISGLCSSRHLGYANARTMRISANTILNNAYLRSSQSTSPETNNQIIRDDVASFVGENRISYFQRRKPVGFVNN